MLKWTVHKRADPTVSSGDAGTRLSNLLLAPTETNDNKRLHARRSLGNLSRPVRTAAREKQRKSLGSSEISKRIQNKENHLVHTPHPYGHRQNVSSTPVIAFGTKLEYALRDVRNITPKQQQQQTTNPITSIIEAITPSRKRPLAKTPPTSPQPKIDTVICSSPKQQPPNSAVISATPYASTLPTFDIEYSPCGATQPILQTNTMSSITTDTFFGQPRYFQEPLPASKRLKFSPNGMTPLSSRLSELRFSKLNFRRSLSQNSSAKKQAKRKANEKCEAMVEHSVEKVGNQVDSSNNVNNNNDINKNNNHCAENLYKRPFDPVSVIPSSESTLSSSALDDTALDKMIDAILESARKEPKQSLVRNLAPRRMPLANFMQISSDSPTYTAAEDPASDLNKFCDNFQISPDKLIGERTIIVEEAFNEREVRTPEPLDAKRAKKCEKVRESSKKVLSNSCHLRRQRAVRRKHTKCDQNQQSTQQSEIKQDEKKQNEQEQQQQSDSTSSNEQSSDCSKPESSNFSSPKTPSDSDFVMSSFFKKNADELANMNTPVIEDSNSTYAQQPNCGITSITSKISSYSTPGIHANDLQASSTPTTTEMKSIRRCLTFSDSPSGRSSSATTDDDSLEKRKSTVSIQSTSTLSNSARTTIVSGSLDLSMKYDNNKINIHGESLV